MASVNREKNDEDFIILSADFTGQVSYAGS